jgi:hypothetical protein
MTAPTMLTGHGTPPAGNAAELARFEQLGAAPAPVSKKNAKEDKATDAFLAQRASTSTPAAAPAAPVSRLDRASADRASYLASPPLTPDGGGVAGFLLGLVATAALINFMHGGPTQVKQWLGAKFLNVTTGTPAPPGAPAAGGNTPTPSALQAAFKPPAALATSASPWGAW